MRGVFCAINPSPSPSLDDDVFPVIASGRKLGGERFELLHQKLTDYEVSIPLAVGRNNVPWRVIRVATNQRILIRRLVIIPEKAFFEIPRIELPTFVWRVDTILQPLALFVLADMEKALDDRNSVIGQQSLEFVDPIVPATPFEWTRTINTSSYWERLNIPMLPRRGAAR